MRGDQLCDYELYSQKIVTTSRDHEDPFIFGTNITLNGARDNFSWSRDKVTSQWEGRSESNVGRTEASLSILGQISRRSVTQMHFIRILRDPSSITSFLVDPVRLMSSIFE